MAVRVAKVVRKDVMWKVNHIKGAIKTWWLRMMEESEGKYGGGSAATMNFPRMPWWVWYITWARLINPTLVLTGSSACNYHELPSWGPSNGSHHAGIGGPLKGGIFRFVVQRITNHQVSCLRCMISYNHHCAVLIINPANSWYTGIPPYNRSLSYSAAPDWTQGRFLQRI